MGAPQFLTDDSCFWCGSTPHQRKARRGYVGCKVCAPTDLSDSHATMTAFGMAKLSAKMAPITQYYLGGGVYVDREEYDARNSNTGKANNI